MVRILARFVRAALIADLKIKKMLMKWRRWDVA